MIAISIERDAGTSPMYILAKWELTNRLVYHIIFLTLIAENLILGGGVCEAIKCQTKTDYQMGQ